MRIAGNDFIVQRGEEFSLDKYIVNKDGSPYIVSRQYYNPHILISISSSKAEQKSRYVKRIYLPLDDMEQFYFTNVIPLTDVTDKNGTPLYTDYPENLSLGQGGHDNAFLYGHYKGRVVSFEVNDAVFSCEKDGKTYYKYWKPDDAGALGKWYDYDFRLVYTFSTSFTKSWVPQTYHYSVELVTGRTLAGYLHDVCEENGLEYKDVETTLSELKSVGLVSESLTETDLLGRIDAVFPLLTSAKISVLSNIGGKYGG